MRLHDAARKVFCTSKGYAYAKRLPKGESQHLAIQPGLAESGLRQPLAILKNTESKDVKIAEIKQSQERQRPIMLIINCQTEG
jgi:hypothetical protein